MYRSARFGSRVNPRAPLAARWFPSILSCPYRDGPGMDCQTGPTGAIPSPGSGNSGSSGKYRLKRVNRESHEEIILQENMLCRGPGVPRLCERGIDQLGLDYPELPGPRASAIIWQPGLWRRHLSRWLHGDRPMVPGGDRSWVWHSGRLLARPPLDIGGWLPGPRPDGRR